VRRMLAMVGSECSSFDHGRQQMELLADLKVTTKAVERVTENIGADIAQREQQTIQQAMQLELPVAVGQSIPVMYIQIDATGVPVTLKETEGRSGKGEDGRAHHRDARLGCVFTQTTIDDEGKPVRDEESTTYTGPSRLPASSPAASTRKLISVAGTGRKRKWRWATVPIGSGTSPRSSSQALPKS
jgi:hypothetical protein